MADRPKISIVTPSFNQGQYLEETIRSVLDQNYPNLEYIVMDGGSTDGSVEIIRRYADRLAYWTSAKDEGQYDALQKGFQRSTGEIMAWLNSDDKYLPWSLSTVADIFSEQPQIEWISSIFPMWWDKQGRPVSCDTIDGYNRVGFFLGEHLLDCGWAARGFIQQESTFWRRSLWDRAGARIDTSLKLAGDFELWTRFAKHAELYGVRLPLGGFRNHGEQKTARAYQEYLDEARRVFEAHGGKPNSRLKAWVQVKLMRKLAAPFRRWAYKRRLVRPRHWCAYDFKAGKWDLRKVRFN
jgi:glycosyltransferase involved in cell wall biosynthesis